MEDEFDRFETTDVKLDLDAAAPVLSFRLA
jgi:hypothetical protein